MSCPVFMSHQRIFNTDGRRQGLLYIARLSVASAGMFNNTT